MLSPKGKCFIGIDYKAVDTEREERQCLAHDIGHCLRGAFYNAYSPLSLIDRQEHRANAEAIKYLVPKEEMIAAMQEGLSEVWQLSEYFDVDEDFIRFAFREYFDCIV